MKYLVDLRKKLDLKVKANVKHAQKRQKKFYDARHSQGCFTVGQKVLVRNMKKLSKKGDKMARNWTGPYTICESVGSNTYKLKRVSGKTLKSSYSSSRLKLFHEKGNVVEFYMYETEVSFKLQWMRQVVQVR